jgi:putative PIN family toxin of toxin-antitoxin system
MIETGRRIVFDCMIYAQAIVSEKGPAGACLEHVMAGKLKLIWSEYVLREIRELPAKLPNRLQVTSERVELFIATITPYAENVAVVPHVYDNPFDPDDSPYIDLALTAGANLITTRDGDLLRLMDRSRPEAVDFHNRFPSLQILPPEAILKMLREELS